MVEESLIMIVSVDDSSFTVAMYNNYEQEDILLFIHPSTNSTPKSGHERGGEKRYYLCQS